MREEERKKEKDEAKRVFKAREREEVGNLRSGKSLTVVASIPVSIVDGHVDK